MRADRFDPDAFLRNHWQKRPLLIRDPWPSWTNPLDPDDLAGLACEEGVESRLITRDPGTWSVEHGPFPEARFAQTGDRPWTLLVQAVDHLVPEVAALLDSFRFIPNWRLDDIMVSYATDGGGVGPHFDQYDVFLVQGLGRRRWRIGGRCDAGTPLLPHDDLRLLAAFEPSDEWLLEPGDILYLPPGLAHDGVAVGDDCMTYSVGLRAPSRAELIGHWAEQLVASLPDSDRYADPDLGAQPNPGEIVPAAIARLHAMVTAQMLDRDAFARWFAAHATAPKYPERDWRPEQPVVRSDLRRDLAAGAVLRRNPASRFSFIRQGTDTVLLFADGRQYDCTGPAASLAETLCARDTHRIDAALTGDAVLTMLAGLIDEGSLILEDAAHCA